MALSGTQKGVVGQFEFLQVAIVTGAGEVLAYVPTADDEQRDAELHRRGGSAFALGVQVKISSKLERLEHHRHPYLRIIFRVALARIVSSAGFWYFFGHFDFKQLRFIDPVFLVPSRMVHRHCRIHSPGSMAVFCFTASMNPEAHDLWTPYRISTADLGPRVLEILKELPRRHDLTLRSAPPMSGVSWLGRRQAA